MEYDNIDDLEETEVVLNPAFWWKCKGCGAEQILMCKRDEASDEEKIALGIELWQEYSLVYVPVEVKCDKCGCEFEGIPYFEIGEAQIVVEGDPLEPVDPFSEDSDDSWRPDNFDPSDSEGDEDDRTDFMGAGE